MDENQSNSHKNLTLNEGQDDLSLEEEVLKTPNVDAERSERTPYYIDLEKTFYLGTLK